MADELLSISNALCAYRCNLINGGFSEESAEAISRDAAEEIHAGQMSRAALKSETEVIA